MRSIATVLLLLCLSLTARAEESGPLSVTSYPPAGAAGDNGELSEVADTDPYGSAYTAEELTQLDKALWAANLTRGDLNFHKDFGKGYECYPAVRQMMADPLLIAPQMRGLQQASRSSGTQQPLLERFIAVARKTYGEEAKMSYEEWAAASDWSYHVSESPDSPWTAEDLRQLIELDWEGGMGALRDPQLFDALRLKLPGLMAWHEVFDAPADIDAEDRSAIDQWIEAQPADWYMRGLSDGWYYSSTGVLTDYLLRCAGFDVWARTLPSDFFPQDEPLVLESPQGQIVIGTQGNDSYVDLDCALLIEPGGNDRYINCRLAGINDGLIRATALAIDLDGADHYDCADVNFTLGAAVLGNAAFYDLGADNDHYAAGNASLAASIAGVATFYDDGGSDYYSGKAYTQGAAGFGIAVMCDDSVQPAPVVPFDVETPDPIDAAAFDNDTYVAWSEAQGFARTRGIAICTNARGNETYQAGGVYLHAPLFTDRYQSFSQGFAIGERDIDYAGGIALLADYAGNDRYLGDIYNQGVGYWYSAGFLYDGAGNDLYEMSQYGQGSGIHLAVGGLIDESGSDTYIMNNGLGQGGSHDYAASVFMDRGGNDRYLGNTSCNGAGLTNSVGLFFDRSGDDVYAAKRNAGFNGGSAARGFGSIGVLVDLAGQDDYLGLMRDDMLWNKNTYGVGIDAVPAALEGETQGGGNNAGFDTPREDIALPEIIAFQGALTQEVFDELYEIAIRWEVGDNRVITPEARKRLIAFGTEVLPLVEANMDDTSSLASRAFADIIKAFSFDEPPVDAAVVAAAEAAGDTPPQPVRTYRETYPLVEELLRRQLADADDNRKTAALRIIGDLKLESLGADVATLLTHPDPPLQRRVIGVLGLTGSHAADDQLVALLGTDEAMTKVAVEALTGLRVEAYPQLSPLLADPSFMVRDTLVNQLVANFDWYKADIHDDFMNHSALPVRGQRSLMQVLMRVQDAPSAEMIGKLWGLLQSADWGVRADAVRLTEHWDGLTDDPELDVLFSGMTGLAREVATVRETYPEFQVEFLPAQQ
jgi:hypothetical protein